MQCKGPGRSSSSRECRNLPADLVRHIDPCPKSITLEFIRASSYGAGTQSSGEVALGDSTGLSSLVADKHVLVVSKCFLLDTIVW